MDLLARISEIGIIPVISLPRLDQALPLAEALLKGGLPCAEVTFRTAAAAEAIAEIRARFPEMLVGAGTVLSTEQAERALDVGAQFLVSPGTNPAVVDYAHSHEAVIFPGICTPTEIEQALAHGCEVLKFFPAEQIGGIKLLKALMAPYRQVRFIPTGGIEPANLKDYLNLSAVVACGGSWMVKPELIAAGDFAEIERLTSEAVALAKRTHGDTDSQTPK
jgi:2-dehydro-3-deoxyphosphogluconate aldolase/(4S)-4-hydroxy-2-oxoglutarate aldolase